MTIQQFLDSNEFKLFVLKHGVINTTTNLQFLNGNVNFTIEKTGRHFQISKSQYIRTWSQKVAHKGGKVCHHMPWIVNRDKNHQYIKGDYLFLLSYLDAYLDRNG